MAKMGSKARFSLISIDFPSFLLYICILIFSNDYSMNKNLKFFLVLILTFLNSNIYPQIKIRELPFPNLEKVDSLYWGASESREIMHLISDWNVYSSKAPESKTETSVPCLFEGTSSMIFERELFFSQNQIDRNIIYLYSLGINYSSEISLNNFVIYKHHNGEIPFYIKLPSDILIPDSPNKLVIKVDYDLNSESTIPLENRFLFPKEYGGLVKNIYLKYVPLTHMSDLKLEFEKVEESNEVKIDIKLGVENLLADTLINGNNINTNDFSLLVNLFYKEARVHSTNYELDSNLKDTPQLNYSFSISNLEVWTPKNPKSYLLEVQLLYKNRLIDEIDRSVAFYFLEKSESKIKLNGNSFTFKGVTYFTSSNEVENLDTYQRIEDDLNIIKDLGFNSVRFAKTIPHPYALQLCEKIGLLAFIELPLNSAPDEIVSSKAFETKVIGFANEFVDYFSGFSAVAAIGIGSSFISNSPLQTKFVKTIAENVKAKSKYFTYASFIGLPNSIPSDIDFYGLEFYANDFQNNLDTAIDSFGNDNVMVSEITYPTYLGSSNGYFNKFSHEAQAKYFAELIDYSNDKNLSGFFINTIFDYKGECASLFAGYNEDNIFKIGILNDERDKNIISYKVIHSKLQDRGRVTIPIGDQKEDSPVFFILLGLFLSVGIALLINSKRKFREDASRALMRPYNFYADIRDHRILSGLHSIALMIILAAAKALLITNLLFFFRSNLLIEKLLLSIGSNWLLTLVGYLSWNPVNAFLYLFVFFFLFIIFVSLLIKLGSFFVKNRIEFSSIYFVVIWSLLPVALLLPVELVLYRVLTANIINTYIYIFLVVYHLWLIQRLLKGIYVVFDVAPSRVYLFSLMIFVIVFGGTLLYLQISNASVYYVINAIKQYSLI